MIHLYQGPSAWGLPNISPFCVKIETYMKMAKIPHQTHEGDIRKAPKGKIPWITHGEQTVSDSSDIVDHLAEHFTDLDEGLSPTQEAQGLLMQRALEEHIYWSIVYFRWVEDEGFAVLQPVFAEILPPVIGSLILCAVIRRGVRRDLKGHGLGRHKPEEILARVGKDMQALSDLLGEKKYLLDDQPRSVDAAAYGQLSNILFPPPEQSPLKKQLRGHQNLVDYCDRIRAAFFD